MRVIYSFIFLSSLFLQGIQAQTLELLLGNAWNMREDLVIKQDGYPDILVEDAYFNVEAFVPPLYYSLRWAFFEEESGAWEIELNHLKLYLDEFPNDVQAFDISHGYNLLWFNRAWFLEDFILHAGAGVVIAHPNISVRNQNNYSYGNENHSICGGSLHASIQKRFDITQKWFLSLEAKAVYALADVPFAQGSVVVQNRSLHATFGFGYKF